MYFDYCGRGLLPRWISVSAVSRSQCTSIDTSHTRKTKKKMIFKKSDVCFTDQLFGEGKKLKKKNGRTDTEHVFTDGTPTGDWSHCQCLCLVARRRRRSLTRADPIGAQRIARRRGQDVDLIEVKGGANFSWPAGRICVLYACTVVRPAGCGTLLR